MDWAMYQEVSRKTQKTSIEEAYVESYRAAIEQIETWFLQEEKTHEMNASKIETKSNIKKSC